MADKTLKVIIAGDAAGALSALGETEVGAGSLGDKLGGLGGIAVAGFAVVAAAAVGAGIGLFKIGENFSEAMDKISVQTGKTGDDLTGLMVDFENVATTTPAKFDDITAAIGGVSQKLGLTGPPLEALSTQLLTVSRVTKGDLNANISASTSLFNNWGIATSDQSRVMEQLFRASQASGVGFTTLTQEVTDNGVKLRALGMTTTQSIELFAGLGKAGLSAADVMPAFSKELAFAAKHGEDAGAVLKNAFDGIENGTFKASDAIKLFGAKGGVAFFDMAKEGKLHLSDLSNTVVSGSDTIEAAGTRTEHFGEKWQRFSNQVQVALEPLATQVFDGVGRAMDALTPIATNVIHWVSDQMIPAISNLGVTAAPVFDKLNLVLPILGEAFTKAFGAGQAVIQWLGDHQPILIGLGVAIGTVLVVAIGAYTVSMASAAVATVAATWPILAIVAVIAALVAGVIWAWNNWEFFRNAVTAVVNYLVTNVPPAFEMIRGAVMTVFNWIVNVAVPAVVNAFNSFVGFLQNTLWPAVQTVWTGIQTVIGWAVNVIKPIISFLVDFIASNFGHIAEIARNVWDMIGNIISNAWQIISNIIQLGLNLISGHWGAAWDNIKNILSAVWDTIRNVVSNGIGVVRELIQTLVSLFGNIAGRIGEGLVGLASAITSPFRSAFNSIAGLWNSTIGHMSVTIPDWVPGIGGKSFSAPTLPTFAAGGFVPGAVGSPQLIIAHGGEQIIPVNRSTAGNINITVNGFVGDQEALGREITRQLVAAQRAGVAVPWAS